MAIAFVQSATGGAASVSTSITAVWPGNTTTGNMIVVAAATGNGTTTSAKVSDTQGNIYNYLPQVGNASGDHLDIWYALNITGGTTPTITVTVQNGAVTTLQAVAQEFSGIATTTPFDASARTFFTVSAASVSINSTTSPTRSPNELVIFAVASGSSTAGAGAATGYSNLASDIVSTQGLVVQSKVVSSTGFQSATAAFSPNSGCTATIVTFSDTPLTQATVINNYQFPKVGDGMSVTEKIR